jgi:hypothetical protein
MDPCALSWDAFGAESPPWISGSGKTSPCIRGGGGDEGWLAGFIGGLYLYWEFGPFTLERLLVDVAGSCPDLLLRRSNPIVQLVLDPNA